MNDEDPDWFKNLPGAKKATITIKGLFRRPVHPAELMLAADELMFQVDDPASIHWKVGEVGETEYAGRQLRTEVLEVVAPGLFKMRILEELAP